MSVWTSNYAIMRDLSKAQGRLVPVDVSSPGRVAVAANEKPPQLATEETEEEFYDKFACGDFDYSTAPDFSLIKEMLEMVRDDGSESSDNNTDGMIQINKVNTLSETKPEAAIILTEATVTDTVQNPTAGNATVKKKRQRNVAVSSLLAALEKENNNEPIKLLKPTDFISTKAVTESVRKVDEWFTNKENTVQKTFPSLSSASMFKRKSVSEKSDKPVEKKSGSLLSRNSYAEGSNQTIKFKPSPLAVEYYEKFMEQSQLKNSIREDIWQKAERLMKEADAKIAAKAAQKLDADSITERVKQRSKEDAGAVATENESSNSIQSIVNITLTEPRHTGTDENCIVCAVVQKHGYQIPIYKTVTTNTSYSFTDYELD